MIYFMCPRSRTKTIKSFAFDSETLDRRIMSVLRRSTARRDKALESARSPRDRDPRVASPSAPLLLIS